MCKCLESNIGPTRKDYDLEKKTHFMRARYYKTNQIPNIISLRSKDDLGQEKVEIYEEIKGSYFAALNPPNLRKKNQLKKETHS